MQETIESIIQDAYKLYMPQVENEIKGLYGYVKNHFIFTEFNRATRKQKQLMTATCQPYTIVEIGTKFGGTFYLWNKLIDLCGYPPNILKCISIDMNDGGQHGGISEEEMDKRDLWFLERFPHCHFIRGNSHDESVKVRLKELLVEGKIDFLFIDGDHTYEGVKQDFQEYSKFCTEGSIVAFHDIVQSEHHRQRNVHVGRFWSEIAPSYKTVEFNENQNWAGIGLLIL